MFTSLSTRTGQPRCWESTERTGNWFQPGMIGGATGTPSRNETGPGTPTPAPCMSTALPLGPQLADQVEHHGEDGVRAVPDVDRLGHLLEDVQPAVGDGDVDRGGADVDAEEAQAAGQPDDGRAPAAAGRGQAAGLDQPDLGEPVELDGELGAGQLDGLAELGPAHRAVVAQQAQQRGLVRVLGPHRHSPHTDLRRTGCRDLSSRLLRRAP